MQINILLTLPLLIRSDGPVADATVTTTAATMADTSVTNMSGVPDVLWTDGNCNPLLGYRFFRISNGGPVRCDACGCTWDFFEFIGFSSSDETVTFQVVDDAGAQTGYPAENILDGNTASYWYGNHDLGEIGGQCWDSTKAGKQWVIISVIGDVAPISRMVFYQGGEDHCCNINSVRLECSNDGYGWDGLTAITLATVRTEVEFREAGLRYSSHLGGFASAPRQCGILFSFSLLCLLFGLQ